MSNHRSEKELGRIFKKSLRIIDAETSLKEGSLAFLISEKMEPSEIDTVRTAIQDSRDQTKQLEDYIKSLKGAGIDTGKIPTTTKHINDILQALDKADKDLSAVSFRTGSVSTFLGKKLTLPQIIQAAVSIQRKVAGFNSGFKSAFDNISKNLVPLAKAQGANTKPLRDMLASEDGMPDPEIIQKGIKDSIVKSLRQDWMSKVVDFFGGAMKRGATKDILDMIPKLDGAKVGEEFAEAMMSASVGSFTKLQVPDIPPKPTADPAVQSASEKAKEESSKEEDQGFVDKDGNPTPVALKQPTGKDETTNFEVNSLHKFTTNKGKETFVKIVEVMADGDVVVQSVDGKGGFRNNKFRISGARLGEKVEPKAAGIDPSLISDLASGDGSGPASEEEAKKEQDEAESNLKQAVQDSSSDKDQSPKTAALKAIEDWSSSLSASSQKELRASNRLSDLRDVVGMALDDAASAVEGEVRAAIQAWRDDHEEQLIKNKRFSKKNFESLEELIPRLVGFMMKAKNESRFSVNKRNIQKIVFSYLDRRFDRTKAVLSESPYSESEMILYRMNRMAGLKND